MFPTLPSFLHFPAPSSSQSRSCRAPLPFQRFVEQHSFRDLSSRGG